MTFIEVERKRSMIVLRILSFIMGYEYVRVASFYSDVDNADMSHKPGAVRFEVLIQALGLKMPVVSGKFPTGTVPASIRHN